MKKLPILAAAAIAFTAFISPANATAETPAAPAPAVIEIPLTAPEATITFEKPAVSTEAAPIIEEPAVTQIVTEERIEEDDPRWDCTTMGNRICGTTPLWTPPAPQVIAPSPAPIPAPTAAPVDRCEEDEPCWEGSANDSRVQNPEIWNTSGISLETWKDSNGTAVK